MELPDYLPERIREVVEVDRLSRFLLTQYMRSTVCTPPRHKGHLPPFSTVLTQVGQRHQCPHGCIACVFALVRQMQHGSASALRSSPPPAPSAACAFGRLVQQTEKRRCVSAWSLVHQAEKRRCCFLPRPSASSLTVTQGLATGALLLGTWSNRLRSAAAVPSDGVPFAHCPSHSPRRCSSWRRLTEAPRRRR